MHRSVTRRVTTRSLALAAQASVLVAATGLGGCGDDRAAPPQQPGVAPVGSPQAATVGSAEVLAQVRALGLDRLQLEDPGERGLEVGIERDARVVGPPAPPIPESPRAIDRASPGRLLGSTLDALAAGDVAALARLSRSPATRPALDQDDADDAARRFLAAPARSLWTRVATAARAGRLEVVPAGPGAAVMRIQVGGALGTVELRLKKEADGWYLAS